MYLGWPKAASSWLFAQFQKHNAVAINHEKENHLWYTDPTQAMNCFDQTNGNLIVDFSTNNWSMDSYVAKLVSEKFDYFILMHRNPVEIVSSYYLMNQQGSWEDWQISCLYNKLCNTGDVLERWHDIVNDKLVTCEYNDVCQDSQLFLNKLFSSIGIPSISADNQRSNESKQKHLTINNKKLIGLIEQQEKKFNKLIKERQL